MSNEKYSGNWAIVGFEYNDARKIMVEIEQNCEKTVVRRIGTKNTLVTEFSDGTILRWIRNGERVAEYEFNKMWCDRKIDDDMLQYMITPMYKGVRKDIIWL